MYLGVSARDKETHCLNSTTSLIIEEPRRRIIALTNDVHFPFSTEDVKIGLVFGKNMTHQARNWLQQVMELGLHKNRMIATLHIALIYHEHSGFHAGTGMRHLRYKMIFSLLRSHEYITNPPVPFYGHTKMLYQYLNLPLCFSGD